MNVLPPGEIAVAQKESRVLVEADRLFYANGIGGTSMREIARAAGTSLGRLSREYRSKELLVVGYLARRHERDVTTLATLRSSGLEPTRILDRALGGVISDLLSPHFRGCAFLNAAAETEHEYALVKQLVRDHRDWYSVETTQLLRQAGHPRAADAADDLVVARDGGMASIHGGNTVAAIGSMRRAIQRTFAELP
jgi:AcrR family transcriptional regulator